MLYRRLYIGFLSIFLLCIENKNIDNSGADEYSINKNRHFFVYVQYIRRRINDEKL